MLSSTVGAKEVFAASAAVLDKNVAENVLREKKWRFGYAKHVFENLVLCSRSEKAALQVSQAGLDHVYDKFEFIRPDGQVGAPRLCSHPRSCLR